ncbi:hypothetical protein BBK14_26820 [Parafrankia soli]|uniref:Oxidoreductase n=1 Tax=Parafrankia soli TaxID=2599596 RepID=A0A1S1PJB9_9ACTN|nr:hypothetical protein BBK14_26820 [Parafrankia soli]
MRRTTPAPPVRIVHLGLGAFCRSHTAWYTHHAADSSDWGIAAYAGRTRSRDLTARLARQNGLYSIVERGPVRDRVEVIGSIVRAHSGGDVPRLVADLSAAATAIITLTITETGYRLRADDTPDWDDPSVVADAEILRGVARGTVTTSDARPVTALGRLLLGLDARRRAGSGPVAVVSCDNLSDNGGRLRRGLSALAAGCLPETAAWIAEHAAFVSSSVDRITPRLAADEAAALAAEYADEAVVVTEPFRDWILCGRFPAGRPAWEAAQARFVADIEPWEARKLWLLNGAHTLLACLGLVRGHDTVARAVADPVCRDAVNRLWNEAERHLPDGLDVPAYRRALLERFENPRIEHPLAQIAIDTLTKLRLRVVPVAERELAAGREAAGCATAIAAWVVAARRGALPQDASSESVRRAAGAPDPVLSMLTLLSAELAKRRRPFQSRIAAAQARIDLADP